MTTWEGLSGALSSPNAAVGLVAFVLTIAGFFVLFTVNRTPNSPLNQYLIQILGLCFILPVLLLVSVMIDMKPEAITGLLGTLIGYIFGTSAQSRPPPPNSGEDEQR